MSRTWWFHVLLPLAFHLASCASDLFTSTQHMQEVMRTERLTFQDAHYFILLEKNRLDGLVLQHELFTAVASRHAGHAVLKLFLLPSRLTSLLSHSKPGAPFASLGTLRKSYTSPPSRGWWPTDRDLRGASEGVCKLQRTYQIPVGRMAAMQSRLLPAASPEDFRDVARGCFSRGPFGNTSMWSLSALERDPSQGSLSRRRKLGFHWLQANDVRWPRWRRSQTSKRPAGYPNQPENDVDTYKSACVEESDVRPTTANLVCKMSTNFGKPELVLQPHKIEVLSLKPRVVLVADFLTPSEVNYLRTAAQKGLRRGGIYTEQNPAGRTSWARTNKVSWLWDARHAVLQRVTRRIAVATGLSLESAEAYQVANYGLGGHYTPHADADAFHMVADAVSKSDGNRLATMLMYLSDVQAGGATAFVELGVAVKPRVGAALFWYNVEPYEGSESPVNFSFWHQKRTLDDRTWHVGCPVLWGSKWIVTKWIHERTNVHVRYDTPG